MKIKHCCSRATFVILAATIFGVICPVTAQEPDYRRVAPQKAILLSQINHKDFAKSNFHFGLGVRGDSESPFTRNVYDVRYGGVSLEGVNDWLDVPISNSYRSQIKDLGELNWSDVYDTPFLPANPVPHSGGMSLSYNSGKLVTAFPEGVLVRAVVGHMFLVHSKD